MPTLSHNQEILLTRQRHEADRAGLHFDYRIVVGDKAYSWATKKELPKLGETQLLFEQPVHTASYALSRKVVIPKGQYGAGVTTLDWVKRGKIRNELEKPDQFSIILRNKNRLFFKKLPEQYGDGAWLFRHLPPKAETPMKIDNPTGNKYLAQIEKKSSLILGAAGTHLAQNLGTKYAMGSKTISKYLANSFSEGTKGVVNTSLKSKAARMFTGAALPDVALAHKKVHDLGTKMKPLLETSTKRQQVGMRMMSQGRFGDLAKYKLDKDPMVKKVHSLASEHIKMPALDSSVAKSKNLSALFKDKSHPLLSNISSNISRGKVPLGPQYKPGTMTSKAPVVGSALSAIADPAGGAMSTVKNLMGSKTFTNSKIGGKISHHLEKQFVFNPIKKGISDGSGSNFKHKVYETAVNPLSANLKRTSAAITDAIKN